MPTNETAAPRTAEPATGAAPEAAANQVTQDLTIIKGIGPAVQKKLNGLNIVTFSDLAKADPDALAEKLRGSQPISVVQVRAWIEAAHERAQA